MTPAATNTAAAPTQNGRWTLISTHSYAPFVIYRIVLAVAVAVLLLTGTVPAEPSGPVGVTP